MKTILAIDPKQADLEHLKQCLLNVHPESTVLSYTDPLLAFQYIFNNKVDAVFTVIYMRRLDGLRFAKMVQEIHPQIPIYFMEANTKGQRNALQRGAAGYFVKPVTTEDIHRAKVNKQRKEKNVSPPPKI